MSARAASQRGLVLITSLLLLVVLTLLAIGMFRGFGLQEQISGNVREKTRAVNAAEVAEQYAESYLASGNAASATVCTTPVTTFPAVLGQVCTQTLQQKTIDPTVLPWGVGVDYYPQGPTDMSTVMSTNGGSNTYYLKPRFYIAFLATSNLNGMITNVYQIDAVGYGGSANTAAVIEATYQVQTSTKNLGETQ